MNPKRNKNEKQSKGGRARAERLTSEKRSEIAKKAATSRWEVPKAIYGSPDKPLLIGDISISCYVLGDETRVLTQSEVISGLDMKKGSYHTGADRLTRFLEGKIVSQFVPLELIEAIKSPIRFSRGKQIFYGYRATLLPDLCDAVLDARKAGVLQSQQAHIADRCEVLMRGLARVGIIALVDEVTGYQQIREREVLNKILNKYLTDKWSKWSKTFPNDFYKELFRLKGMPYPTGDGNKRPSYVGSWTNDIVYSRLAPGVKEALCKKNPRLTSGSRARKHHQHLTSNFGHPSLKEHLSNVIFLMKTCSNYDDFQKRLNSVKPKYGENLNIDFKQS